MAGPAAAASGGKLAMYDEMVALARQVVELKTDPAQAARVASLLARYGELSAALGGDDPGDMLAGKGSAPVGGQVRRGGPSAPPNCSSAIQTFDSENVPVDIPDIGVVTSTLTVAGVDSYLWHIDAQTSISHTFAADLDVTLMSPAGTIVTLTTDNGAGNDDVFNGTAWSDEANPVGQVPYTTNDGLVTDHAYVNLTLASPLVPEEAMAAFIGEDPNGTWTLTISDDLAGDSGTLSAWSLTLTTLDSAPIPTTTTVASTDVPVPIPTGPAVVSSILPIDGLEPFLCEVNAQTFIPHTFAADLDMTLMSPAGTIVTLTTDNGAGNDNVFNGTLWDDGANPGGQVPYITNDGLVTDHAYVNLTLASPLVPEEALGAFNAEDPNGTWTLTVSDDLAGDGGSIDDWSLEVTTCACSPPVADLGVTKTGAVSDSEITWSITASNTGPDDATGVVVADTLAACSLYVSDTCNGNNPPSWTWSIGPLAAGASATCDVVVDASACVGTVSNTATVSGNEIDPIPGNNSATAMVTIDETEVFQPAALEVDFAELASDGNFVFEPGELVEVAPAWINGGAMSHDVLGSAASFTGPAGPTYDLEVDAADYGVVDPTQTASCRDTGFCYHMGVGPPGVERPALHWDASFDETLSEESTHTWALHIGDSFADVARTHLFYRFIETILHHGMAIDCGGGNFCPTLPETREMMAMAVLTAFEGNGYIPPACVEGAEVFADVPFDSPFCPWIEELFDRGVVVGCGGGNYCPDSPVTRASMAVFLLKTLEGGAYTPPPCDGTFDDVSCPSLFAAWIEELFERGITAGCSTGPLAYCPNSSISRGQCAVFQSRTFGLALYGP